ncbi:Succinyl-CoA ligase [ADP-forming] subunit beta [Variovorax sp. SRS16]|uniref:ATP-grasp domain-containing protein n=1 Tax=Variovorax sp. SRS16 TaxID=282217 RepID=UPI001317332B|nr:ATP-grasp domain-containing protein [Variovorax sp. SRS16]VTU28195.1 Succinyl-CoA ligase [ADP-forming] subunit beta [Variovorax sp. SRS16]
MKLLEYEGKALLASHGVPIPPGALWPKQPEAGERGWVVKAQVLAGGRGKRGGILMAATRDELESQAAQLQGKRLGDEPVHAVYVEPMLQIAHEFYLAAFVNRDRGRVTVMASAAGGMDIEQVPPSQVASIDIDPLIGLAGFQVEHLKRALGLAQDIGMQFDHILRQVVEALIEEDAELVEVNPVIQTTEGKLVAADAKVVLDDDAVARHPARSSPIAWSSDSAFMQRCRALGVIGVDNRSRTPPLARPAVALLGNGAGLTMATYDQIAMSGVSVAGAIELHGALARGVAHTAEVIGALFMLEAEIVFINAFYQLRSTDALAQALVQALGMPGAPGRDRVVVRMRGVKQESSQKIMEDAGCFYTPSLSDAADRVLALAAAVGPSQETAR